MKPTTLFAVLAVITSLPVLAQRPPAQGHAAAELLALVEGAGAPSPGERFLATLPEASREALRKDSQVVLDTKAKIAGGGMLRAVIRFDRPADEVFAILTQPSMQSKYLPAVKESKTVGEHTAEGEATDMKVSVFIVGLNYRTQHWFYPEERRIEWTLDPSGGDGLKAQSGFFQLFPLDEKTTIAEYGTRVVLNSGLFEFFRGLGERGGVADALTATRKHVASTKL